MDHIFLLLCKPGDFFFLLDTRHCGFAGYFCTPKNILKLSYLEKVWPFWILLLFFIRQKWNSIQSRANFVPWLLQNPSQYSTQSPMNYEVQELAELTHWNRNQNTNWLQGVNMGTFWSVLLAQICQIKELRLMNITVVIFTSIKKHV